jgi:hypothetical protein
MRKQKAANADGSDGGVSEGVDGDDGGTGKGESASKGGAGVDASTSGIRTRSRAKTKTN